MSETTASPPARAASRRPHALRAARRNHVPGPSRGGRTSGAGRRRRTGPSRLVALLLLPLLSACGAGGGSGSSASGDGGEVRRAYRGSVLADPVPKVDFVLTDTRGRRYSFVEETRGRVALLFFGYTHCPDVCPVQMANLAAVFDDLPYEVRERIQVVFVTVDPDRDTRRRIRTWLDRFDESFVGLRGSREEVQEIQRRLGLPAAVERPAGDGPSGAGRYTVGHAAQILAFTPDDSAHLAYPSGTRQRDWAHDLPLLARRGWVAPPGEAAAGSPAG